MRVPNDSSQDATQSAAPPEARPETLHPIPAATQMANDEGTTLPPAVADGSNSVAEAPTLPPAPTTAEDPNRTQATPTTPEPQTHAPATPWPSVAGYEILGELGRGGMGVVYQARQVKLKRMVALKMIRDGLLAGPDHLRRFQLEANAVARLQHANIVQIYEIGEQDGRPYFSLEFVDGGNLAQKLSGMPLPAHLAAQMVLTLARAVHYAHQQGIVHRDLKPANVMLTLDGVPKITDFGVAKQLEAEVFLTHTPSGVLLGTPSYMAPEQAWGKPREVGPAADVYALGAILYELVTGQPPFLASRLLETLEQVRSRDPIPPRRLQPRLPRDVETICLKCLEKDQHQRYDSAEALAEDLRRSLAGEPIQARPIRTWERAVKWTKRRPAVAALVAVSSLASVLLVAVLLLAMNPPPGPKQPAADSATGKGAAAAQDQGAPKTEVAANLARDKGLAKGLAAAVAKEAPKPAEEADRQIAYSAHIFQAERALAANNLPEANKHLDACTADLRNWEWHYLKRAGTDQGVPTFHGPAGRITSLAFNPRDNRLATAGLDRTVRIWDPAHPQEVLSLRGHTDGVHSVVFSPDGRRIVSAAGPSWSLGFGEQPFPERGPREEKKEAAEEFGKGWRGPPTATLMVSRSVGLEGQLLALAEDKAPDDQGKQAAPRKKPLPDDGALPALGEVTVWDARTGGIIANFPGKDHVVTCLAFSPDGKWLATGLVPNAALRPPRPKGPAEKIEKPPEELRPPKEKGLPKKDFDDKDKSRDTRTGQDHFALHSSPAAAQEAIFVALLAKEEKSGRQEVGPPRGPPVQPRRVPVMAEVSIWNAITGEEVCRLRGHTDLVTSVAFHPDGQQLASASWDGTVRVWDIPTGKEKRTLRGHNGHVSHLAFSPDGRWLASAGADETVRVWDVSVGKEVFAPLRDHVGEVADVAFSPDGKRLASAGVDRTVKVLDAMTGQLLLSLRGHSAPVRCVAFSPDGHGLASADGDGVVRIWDGTPLTLPSPYQKMRREPGLQHPKPVQERGDPPDVKLKD
jgi:WD40 repeat protein/serine/threonine protein kinase